MYFGDNLGRDSVALRHWQTVHMTEGHHPINLEELQLKRGRLGDFDIEEKIKRASGFKRRPSAQKSRPYRSTTSLTDVHKPPPILWRSKTKRRTSCALILGKSPLNCLIAILESA
jgi:hypothetical protein